MGFVMNEDEFERISNVISSAMAGDYMMDINGFGAPFEMSATGSFLDNLVKEKPEIFQNRDFIIGLLNNIVRFDRSACLYDCLLSRLFIEYVDDTLKNDKDVVMCFVQSFYSVYESRERNCYGVYESDVLEFCKNTPHELLMDSEVFGVLLKRVHPITVYQELLTDDERVDDHILYKVLWAYMKYRDYAAAIISEKEVDHFNNLGLYELQRSWIESVERVEDDLSIGCKFGDMEESDFIADRQGGVYGFFKIYFDYLMEREFLNGYRGANPETIREKNDLYLQYLRDSMECDIDSSYLVGSDEYYSECPFANEYLMDIVKKYWYQICLIAAIGTGQYDMLVELCGGYVKNTSEIATESYANNDGNINCEDFMLFDDSGVDDLPF